MQHYLITGGAGFIGSNLIRTLLHRKEDILISCIDNLDPFYPAAIKERNMVSFRHDPRFRFYHADLGGTSSSQLAEMISEPVDAIIHLAARAGVRPSIIDPAGYQRANILGLQHLLDFAKEKNIRQFVFASTSSVYGVNTNLPWSEDEKLLPISPYAMTKLSGEMLGHVYAHLYDIRFIALRFFTVYGPGQRPDLAIHKFTRAMLRDEEITMYGDGSTSRDYTYVADTVEGIIAAIDYNRSNYEVINLGNNYSVRLSDLVAQLSMITGKQARIRWMEEQPGDVPATYARIDKAKSLLGYQPQTELEEGLRKFYTWYTENQDVLV